MPIAIGRYATVVTKPVVQLHQLESGGCIFSFSRSIVPARFSVRKQVVARKRTPRNEQEARRNECCGKREKNTSSRFKLMQLNYRLVTTVAYLPIAIGIDRIAEVLIRKLRGHDYFMLPR